MNRKEQTDRQTRGRRRTQSDRDHGVLSEDIHSETRHELDAIRSASYLQAQQHFSQTRSYFYFIHYRYFIVFI